MTTATNRSLAVVTAVAAAGVLAGPAPVQIVAGILLAFALPGLAVTAILFRGRDLSAVERVLLAPALSMAVLIISGLAMYVLGIDLNRPAWTAATAGVTLLALFGAALPTRTGPAVEQADESEGVREPAMAAAAARAALAPGAIATGSSATTQPLAAVPDRTEPDRTEPDRTEPDRTEPDRTEPDRTEPDRTEPGDTAAEPGDTAAEPDGTAGRPGPDRIRVLRQLLPLVLAIAVLGAASQLSYRSARDGFETTVTALSAGRPGATNVAGLRDVPVSVTGLVAAQGPYRVVTTGENGLVIDQRVVPGTAGTWGQTLTVPGRQKITVNLFRASDTQPYRTLLISAQR